MRKEIWDDDLSMISPRYDQKYWLLNNDPAVTLNNRQISVAPQRISVTPQFWSRKRVRLKCYSSIVYGVLGWVLKSVASPGAGVTTPTHSIDVENMPNRNFFPSKPAL